MAEGVLSNERLTGHIAVNWSTFTVQLSMISQGRSTNDSALEAPLCLRNHSPGRTTSFSQLMDAWRYYGERHGPVFPIENNVFSRNSRCFIPAHEFLFSSIFSYFYYVWSVDGQVKCWGILRDWRVYLISQTESRARKGDCCDQGGPPLHLEIINFSRDIGGK